jgi:hypothetical protein
MTYRQIKAIKSLYDMVEECEFDWDGEGALAPTKSAVKTAEAFVMAMPIGLALPEFAPEADGDVELDWMPSRGRTFSISVNDSPNLAYAWLDSGASGHGVAIFDGFHIPQEILDGIKRIVKI